MNIELTLPASSSWRFLKNPRSLTRASPLVNFRFSQGGNGKFHNSIYFFNYLIDLFQVKNTMFYWVCRINSHACNSLNMCVHRQKYSIDGGFISCTSHILCADWCNKWRITEKNLYIHIYINIFDKLGDFWIP